MQALLRDGSECQRIFGQGYQLFVRATSTVSLNWSTYYQWGASLRALSHKIVHLSHGLDSLRVLRESLLRLQRSASTNKAFHGCRVEIILAILDVIVHPGRDLLGEDSRNKDAQALFRLGSTHMSELIVLERHLLALDDVSAKRSVSRFRNGSNHWKFRRNVLLTFPSQLLRLWMILGLLR